MMILFLLIDPFNCTYATLLFFGVFLLLLGDNVEDAAVNIVNFLFIGKIR